MLHIKLDFTLVDSHQLVKSLQIMHTTGHQLHNFLQTMYTTGHQLNNSLQTMYTSCLLNLKSPILSCF